MPAYLILDEADLDKDDAELMDGIERAKPCLKTP